MTVPQVELAPGYCISRLIKGGWQTIGRGPEVVEDLLQFVAAGVTTFETSDSYAGGEELMGALRAAAHDRLAAETFAALRIHTRYTAPLSGSGPTPSEITRSVERSLQRLGVERLDLVQIQWWNLDVAGLIDTGLVLADLQQQGKIGLIGTANFGMATLERLAAAGVPIATNQVHYSLIDRRAENGLAQYCARRGIGLMTFAPLAGGFLSERWLSDDDPRATDTEHSAEYRALIDAGGGWQRCQRLLAALDKVARRCGCSMATVALAWVLQYGPGAAVLFGASSAARLPEVLKALDVVITAEDRIAIEDAGLDRPMLDVGDIERAPDSPLMRAIYAQHS